MYVVYVKIQTSHPIVRRVNLIFIFVLGIFWVLVKVTVKNTVFFCVTPCRL